MPKLIELQRNSDISRLGLTHQDILKRGIVAVGYAQNELLPPYDDEAYEKRAKDILLYLESFDKAKTIGCPLDISDVDWNAKFPNTKTIEVVGGFAEWCVPTAVREITRTDKFALINSRLIFSTKSSYSDFIAGREVMRGVLEERNCLIVGREKFIYYNPLFHPSQSSRPNNL